MKILHILDHSLPLHSGYTFRSQNIFKAQKRMGFKTVVLTSSKHEESYKKETQSSETINDIIYYRSGRTPILRIPVVPEITLMHRLYKRILDVAETEKPDIIHAHSPILNGIPAIQAAKRLSIPVVYEIRAFWEDAAVDHGTYAENSWKYKLTKTIETWVCKKADHVCILCNGLKNDLISRGITADKITPIFNGVNPEDLKPVPPDEELVLKWGLKDKKIIGFVGSFYRYEGLDLLIQAFKTISETDNQIRLLLVGGGEMEKELKKQVSHYNLGNKVIMPGRIPHEKIAGVYAMIDILAYPRYSMRLTELVTPLKPLEAMAMKKVLIASDVGGHKELISNNKTGLLFTAGDAEHLSETILKLINNGGLVDEIRHNGYEWVRKHHNWDVTTSIYSDIYKKLKNR